MKTEIWCKYKLDSYKKKLQEMLIIIETPFLQNDRPSIELHIEYLKAKIEILEDILENKQLEKNFINRMISERMRTEVEIYKEKYKIDDIFINRDHKNNYEYAIMLGYRKALQWVLDNNQSEFSIWRKNV